VTTKSPKSKLRANHRYSNPKKIISFFSGALGMDLGLHSAGLKCLALNEIDPTACKTIRSNLGSVFAATPPRLYEGDIRELSAELLCKDLGIKPRELFAVVGGPPCQAFSTAGRRFGLNDERGNVFLHFIELALALAPKYVIFENVRGLLSVPLQHRPHSQRGTGFPPATEDEKPKGALLHIIRMLETAGYKVTFNLYNTANFGVPQIRERLIFFASRDGASVPFLQPTHSQHGENGLPKWLTFRDAVSDLPAKPCESGKFPETRLKYYRLLEGGQNWRSLPETLQKEAMGGSWYAGGGKTGFFRRLAWDKPAPTLVTSPIMPATDLCHPEELRPLSVQEYRAIQTFPRDYVFEGSLTDRYRQIGNAVPCNFGEIIGRHAIAFDKGKLQTNKTIGKYSRYIGTDHDSWRSDLEPRQQELFV
jgi:DNA (cytosine-5)-methyltransferase 1